MWKLDISPEKETKVIVEPFKISAKRKAFLKKLEEEKSTTNKMIKINPNIDDFFTDESFEKCPICDEDFKPEQLQIHGQECAEKKFG